MRQILKENCFRMHTAQRIGKIICHHMYNMLVFVVWQTIKFRITRKVCHDIIEFSKKTTLIRLC